MRKFNILSTAIMAALILVSAGCMTKAQVAGISGSVGFATGKSIVDVSLSGNTNGVLSVGASITTGTNTIGGSVGIPIGTNTPAQ